MSARVQVNKYDYVVLEKHDVFCIFSVNVDALLAVTVTNIHFDTPKAFFLVEGLWDPRLFEVLAASDQRSSHPRLSKLEIIPTVARSHSSNSFHSSASRRND